MRSIMTLPTEVIYLIIHFIGGNYLRAQVDRLLVCKAWYGIAQPAALEDLVFNIETLPRFLAAPNRAHDLIRTHTRNVSIEGVILGSDTETEIERAGQSSELLESRERRIVYACESLTSFSTHLSQLNLLRSFRLKLLLESPVPELVEKLWIRSIMVLISSLPNPLTSLTIDIPGELSGFGPNSNEFYHLCPLLLAKDILPSLRHLYIRTRSICPKIFELNNSERKPQLETLIINLSLNEMEICATHASYCAEFIPRRNNLYLHMLDVAKDAKCHFPSIRTLMILHEDLPSLQVASYDVISNKRVLLQENVRWDDIDQIYDGATDLDLNDYSDADLFDNSSDTESEAPWIDLEIEAALQ